MIDLQAYGVSAETASGFIDHFEEASGVLLTTEGLAAFMAADPSRQPSLAWWHPDEPELGDQVASAVAAYLCGQPWPLYGDNHALDAYLVVLRAAAVTKGYRVTSWRTFSK